MEYLIGSILAYILGPILLVIVIEWWLRRKGGGGPE